MLSFQVVPIDVFHYIYELLWIDIYLRDDPRFYRRLHSVPASLSLVDVQFYMCFHIFVLLYIVETIKTHWISFLWLHLL